VNEHLAKEKIILILEVLAKKVCAYGNPKRCDCKFALDGKNVGTGTESGNGCCELNTAIAAIKKLTDKQWNFLLDDLPEESSIEFGTTKIKLYPYQVLDMLNERKHLYEQIAELETANNKLLEMIKDLKGKKRKAKK